MLPGGLETKDLPTPTHSLWHNRNFLALWLGQAVSQIGTQVSQFASPLLVLALTGSPALAGFVASLVIVPYAFLSLLAGALVDRWDRKRLMIACDLGRAIALGSIPVALVLGHLTIIQLMIAALVEGIAFTFFNLAESACLPNVVTKEQLGDAVGMNEVTTNLSYMLGPALGGTLFSLARVLPFAVDALSYLLSIFTLARISVAFQGERSVPTEHQSLRREIGEGMRWLWHQPVVRFLTLLSFVGNALVNGLLLFLITLVARLHLPAFVTGVSWAVIGTGGIVGASLVGWLQRRYRYGQLVVFFQWATALVFLCYLLFPFLDATFVRTEGLRDVVLLGVLLPVTFALMTISAAGGAIDYSYRLSLIPDELQGRVNSVYRLVAFAGSPVGLIVMGVLLQYTSLIVTLLSIGSVLVLVALSCTLNRSLCQAPRLGERKTA